MTKATSSTSETAWLLGNLRPLRPVRCLHFTYLLRVPITCCLSVHLSMALITLIKSCPKGEATQCSPSTPHLRAFKKNSCSILRMTDAGIPEKYVVGQGNTWSPLLFKKKTTKQLCKPGWALTQRDTPRKAPQSIRVVTSTRTKARP